MYTYNLIAALTAIQKLNKLGGSDEIAGAYLLHDGKGRLVVAGTDGHTFYWEELAQTAEGDDLYHLLMDDASRDERARVFPCRMPPQAMAKLLAVLKAEKSASYIMLDTVMMSALTFRYGKHTNALDTPITVLVDRENVESVVNIYQRFILEPEKKYTTAGMGCDMQLNVKAVKFIGEALTPRDKRAPLWGVNMQLWGSPGEEKDDAGNAARRYIDKWFISAVPAETDPPRGLVSMVMNVDDNRVYQN